MNHSSTPTTQEPEIIIKASKHIPLAITLGIFLLLSLAANVYMGYTMSASDGIPAFSYLHEQPSPTPTPEPASPWKNISFAGTTFNYPKDWHAAFSTNHSDLSTLALDPDPVRFDSQDISLSTFTIQQIPIKVNQDPSILLQKELNQISDGYYKDISYDSIDSTIGTIHYKKATITGEYMYGKTIEKYFLLTPIKENASQSILIFSLDFIDNKEYSNMLRSMVMSVK